MNVIHVPDVPYPSGRQSDMPYDERQALRTTQEMVDADNQAYGDWKKRWEKIIDVEVDPQKDYNSPLVGGFPPFDFVWIGKNLYKREPESRYGRKRFYTLCNGDKDAPAIMCDCGSFNFSLRYGSCEIRARCATCGIEEVVYDG